MATTFPWISVNGSLKQAGTGMVREGVVIFSESEISAVMEGVANCDSI